MSFVATTSDAADSARSPGAKLEGRGGMAYVAAGDLTKWHVAMDNCTDVSIFCNRSLLRDVESSAVVWTITGHAKGAEIVLDEFGHFMDSQQCILKEQAAICCVSTM